MIGHSRITDTILKLIGKETLIEVENYIKEICSQKSIEVKNQQELLNLFKISISSFLENVSQEELLELRTYTGYNFKNINAILRNNWTYEENGILNDEKRREYSILAQNISNILHKFPNVSDNFKTYRGTTIDSFSKYGITCVKDLECLKGNFLYEQGFTSTSILEDSCYFNKVLDTGKNYNVKIEYIVPNEYDEGALLINNDMSYSINQNEYLINKGSLSKVIDVKVNEELDQAILMVVLVPRKKWDLEKENNKVR